MATDKKIDPISGKTDAGKEEVEKTSKTSGSTKEAEEGPRTVSGKTDAG